jgi:hypothetical protein
MFMLCWVSLMLSVTCKPHMMSVVMLNVVMLTVTCKPYLLNIVMLSVVAPSIKARYCKTFSPLWLVTNTVAVNHFHPNPIFVIKSGDPIRFRLGCNWLSRHLHASLLHCSISYRCKSIYSLGPCIVSQAGTFTVKLFTTVINPAS